MSEFVSLTGNFECPSGFHKENITAQLYHEDIDDDCELWLVRMPCDFDPSLVENKSIVLDGSSKRILSDAYCENAYECYSENYEMPNLCLVLPHKSTRELSPVKKVFKGSFCVVDGIPDDIISKDKEIENAGNVLCDNSDTVPPDDSAEIFDQINPDSDIEEPLTSQGKIKHKHSKKSRHKKSLDVNSIKSEPEFGLDDFPICDTQHL